MNAARKKPAARDASPSYTELLRLHELSNNRWGIVTRHLLDALESQSVQIQHLKLQLDISVALTSLALSQAEPTGK